MATQLITTDGYVQDVLRTQIKLAQIVPTPVGVNRN